MRTILFLSAMLMTGVVLDVDASGLPGESTWGFMTSDERVVRHQNLILMEEYGCGDCGCRNDCSGVTGDITQAQSQTQGQGQSQAQGQAMAGGLAIGNQSVIIIDGSNNVITLSQDNIDSDQSVRNILKDNMIHNGEQILNIDGDHITDNSVTKNYSGDVDLDMTADVQVQVEVVK